MNISLPKTLADCTPEQLSKWVFLSGGGINIETLSQSLDILNRIETETIRQRCDRCTDSVQSFDSYPIGTNRIDWTHNNQGSKVCFR